MTCPCSDVHVCPRHRNAVDNIEDQREGGHDPGLDEWDDGYGAIPGGELL